MAEMTRQFKKLLDGVTNGNGAVGSAVVSKLRESTIYVVFSSGVTAGVVEIEAAHHDGFTGTWANVATVNWAAADRVHYVSITGVHLALRARVSTTISGGTVDAVFIGR